MINPFTETNQAIKDSEALLEGATAMRSHIEAIKVIDPKIAEQVEKTWKVDTKAFQNIMVRSVAARLILGGLYDQIAYRIVDEKGKQALLSMVTGGAAMPESVKRALDNLF